jgi:hypothetical protein
MVSGLGKFAPRALRDSGGDGLGGRLVPTGLSGPWHRLRGEQVLLFIFRRTSVYFSRCQFSACRSSPLLAQARPQFSLILHCI